MIQPTSTRRPGRSPCQSAPWPTSRSIQGATWSMNQTSRRVLPGLIDSHTHALDASLYEFDHEIPDMETMADVLAYVRSLEDAGAAAVGRFGVQARPGRDPVGVFVGAGVTVGVGVYVGVGVQAGLPPASAATCGVCCGSLGRTTSRGTNSTACLA